MDMSDISKLASLLRENGDKVLNGQSKLSLTASLLQNLNQAFCLIVEQNEQDTSSFHVINTNNSKVEIFHDLQFLHDFVQKVVGLKVSHSNPLITEPLKNTLDIAKFRSLKFLELRKVPVSMVSGIQGVRAQLQSVICVRCLQKLDDLLTDCGADHSSGFLWSELREAVLSYNGIETLDSSLGYAPWLQIMDLSHNRIQNVECIDCLPNLKYLNISYNLLESLPVFNKEAARKLQVLVLKNNYIEDLSGLSNLENLCELDLSCNCLTEHDCLLPLVRLGSLVWLSLEGNPLSFHSQHRLRTARYLHNNTASGKFLLDRSPLTKSERLQVGTMCSSPVQQRAALFCDNASSHSASSSTTSTHTQQIEVPESRKAAAQVSKTQMARKSRQVREAVISEHDGSVEEDTSTLTGSLEISMDQAEHLETKRRIETLREQFGEDHWLHSQGGSCVQNVLGLPGAPLPTPPLLELPHMPLETSEPVNNKSDIIPETSGFEDPPSEDMDVTVQELEDDLSQTSKEGSPMSDDMEESEEVEGQLYLVQKVCRGSQELEELFLVVTDSQLKERDTQSGRTRERWGMEMLQSCVRTHSDPPTIQLTFDTVRRDRQQRDYVLEEEDAQKLVHVLTEMLSARPLMAMNQAAFRCMKCSAQFSQELMPSPISSVVLLAVASSLENKFSATKDLAPNVMKCPTCGSTMVIEMDEEPLPSALPPGERKVKSPPLSSCVAALAQSPSQSSIGSAASLESPGELVLAVRRYDSDIEVISNPSQSSIEVLEGEARTPGRKRSSEERHTVAPPLEPVVPVLVLTGLTESSSSGSLTDSVCTTYENHLTTTPSRTSTNQSTEEKVSKPPAPENGTITQTVRREKLSDIVNIPVKRQQPDSNGTPEKHGLFQGAQSPVVNFSTMFEGLLQSVSSKLKSSSRTRPDDGTSGPTGLNEVTYSFDDFTRVDHRIKLHLHLHVFEGEDEELMLLLRAEILTQPINQPFPGCLVLTNHKVYLLKITGKEGDDPDLWLSKIESLALIQLRAIFVLPWGQGVGMETQDTCTLFLVQDRDRTANLMTSLADSSLPKTCELRDEPPDYLQLAIRQLLLMSCTSDEEDSLVRVLMLFNHCTIIADKESRLGMGALIVTNSDLVLTGEDLHWLFPGSTSPLQPHSLQKMNDISEVEVSGLLLTLLFEDEAAGQREVWCMALRTPNALKTVIEAIRAPWEELFSVPLQVTVRHSD